MIVGDAVVPGHVFRGNPAIAILFVSPTPGLTNHDPVGADVGHQVAFEKVVATSDADPDASAAGVLDRAIAQAAPCGILPTYGRIDVVPVFPPGVVFAVLHVHRVVEAGLYAVVAQLGQRPFGVLEPQSAEMDVLDRPPLRASQLQQTRNGRRLDNRLLHIFAGQRPIEQLARTTVQEPLARPIEHFAGVLEVTRHSHLGRDADVVDNVGRGQLDRARGRIDALEPLSDDLP